MSLLKERIELGVEEAELVAEQKISTFPPMVRWSVAICLVAVVPAYLIAKNVSYKYWASQYRKYEIAAKPSFAEPKNLKISGETLLRMADGTYAAEVSVSNENIDLTLAATDYRLNFLNSSGQTVYQTAGKLFLLPNEQKYIVASKIKTSENIASVKLVLPDDLHWQKRMSLPQVKLVTSPARLYHQDDPQAFVAEGTVYNNSPYTVKKVHLTFLIFDSGGTLLAVSQRDDFTFTPYERRAYKQLWPGIVMPAGAAAIVTAETDVMDSSNLTLQQQPTSPASDLSRPKTDPYGR